MNTITLLSLAFVVALVSRPAAADLTGTYLAYSSKPEVGGIFVAFVVTDLRDGPLKERLPLGLKAICAQSPILPRYRIYVYGDRRLAELARKNMQKVPNMDDPEYQSLQSSVLARYVPETGTIKYKADGKEEDMVIGTDWCKR
jgi:hypothetical protein